MKPKNAHILGFMVLACWPLTEIHADDDIEKRSTVGHRKTKLDDASDGKMTEEHRTKRQVFNIPVVYPYGGTYKLLIGFAAKIQNEDNLGLLFVANFQYQYLQVQNITSVSPYFAYLTVSRDERALDGDMRQNERLVFYRAVEEMLSSKGFNGRECVLRAICEAAQYPVGDEGLVGEILHILLTPQHGKSFASGEDPLLETWRELMSDYTSAQTAGGQMFHCPSIYSGCPQGQGLLELFSILRDD